MADVSSTKGVKRKMAASVSHPPPKPLLSSSVLLLDVPADINTSLPVWEAMRSQQVDFTWTVQPYSITVHLTPTMSKPGKTRTSQKSENAANVAQTLALSSIFLEPQEVTQHIPQQHGTFQSTPCALLTSPKNSTQMIVYSPPLQHPAIAQKLVNTIMVPLPLILTQLQLAHEPSTATKNMVYTPIATAIKKKAPSKMPVPSLYHTKSSSKIKICDNFLLNMCCEGEKCKKHHTALPFHWQLWCLTSHQWIDLSPTSQVLLERIYCNVSHDVVCLKDGNDRYSLNLDSMELDNSSKYDSVRRLTNTEDETKNRFFPSKWKMYWWNSMTWTEFDDNVSPFLLKKMNESDLKCSFHIGANEYMLDFTRMIQTNVTTGFERKVRCRPIYRSPDSMHPHLRTQINIKSTEATTDPPGANFSVDPLEEFSCWYPPVWRLPSEEDCSLVDVPAGTVAYRRVQNLFHESMSETVVDIISIQQIQNLLHWDKYQRHKDYMQKQNSRSKEPLERHLFHGTTKEASEDICHNNFDPRVAGVNGTSNGFGSYFATTSSYSNTYSRKEGPDEVRHMFLAKVLVGKVCMGRHNYHRPPPVNSKKKHYRLYDTCVDILGKPTMFVVFDRCQCYPYYLIKYRDLPKEIDV